jgi:hypothetical protein
MGVDLTLYPVEPLLDGYDYEGHPPCNSWSCLEVPRRSNLWDTIRKAGPLPLNQPLNCYTSKGFQDTTEDAYNSPLEFLPAVKLAKAIRLYYETDKDAGKMPRQTAGVIAYLSELPAVQKIVLYWH